VGRRAFLGLVGAGGIAAIATACGSSGGPERASTGVRKNGLNAGRLSVESWRSSRPERFAFALSTDTGEYASGPPATVALRAPDGRTSAPLPTELHTDGLPAGRGVYVVRTAFTTAGVWNATVQVAGHPDAKMAFEVARRPSAPAPGAKAPRVASPTVRDPLGVDPICTRDPPCALHHESLADVIGAGKPVALMFATPALCQSRYCGPVLDQLLAVAAPYRDRVTFVHCEIYRSTQAQELVPTVTSWGVPGEPMLYGIDGTGVVTARLDGAMGSDEVEALVSALA
jgi:hypothetical protein